MIKQFSWSLLLALTVIFIYTTGTWAADLDWSITWNGDNTIEEEVLIDDQEMATVLENWGFSRGSEAGSYLRHTENWEIYNRLEGKFPITVKNNNYLILYISTFTLDEDITRLNDLTGKKVDLKLTLPGLYYNNSGQRISSLATHWEVYPDGREAWEDPVLTKSIIFNGFRLAVFIVLTGMLVFAAIFASAVNRVNKLIEDEYSIEKYLAELDANKKSE